MLKSYVSPKMDIIKITEESIICQSIPVGAMAPLTDLETLNDPVDLVW